MESYRGIEHWWNGLVDRPAGHHDDARWLSITSIGNDSAVAGFLWPWQLAGAMILNPLAGVLAFVGTTVLFLAYTTDRMGPTIKAVDELASMP